MAGEYVTTIQSAVPQPQRTPQQPAVVQQDVHHAAPLDGGKLPMERVKEAVNRLEQTTTSMSRGLELEVSDSTGEVVVRVVDRAHGKVLRSIPSEEAVQLSERIHEFLGIYFDQSR